MSRRQKVKAKRGKARGKEGRPTTDIRNGQEATGNRQSVSNQFSDYVKFP